MKGKSFCRMDNYPDLSAFCQGYLITPIVEACRRHGLFELLDTREFRERTWLIKELKANTGYFTIALEALQYAGWLEKNIDAYRLTGKVENCSELDLTSLYAVPPEQLILPGPHMSMLIAKIEQLFPGREAKQFSAPHPAGGCIIVPLIVALQGTNSTFLREQFDGIDPVLSQRIFDLFIQQGWLRADKTVLTATGKALVEAGEFNLAAFYRPVLHGIGDLLFGDPARVFGGSGKERWLATSDTFHRRNLSQEVFFEDLRQKIDEICNREPLEKRPQVIVDSNCTYRALFEEIFQTIHLDHLIEVDAQQPVNQALAVLADDHPSHYLDQQGRLVDALTVLSSWQQHFRAV